MKKLVLEITSHSGDGTVTHRSIESFPATLGRGYHNDIILSDPHVSAQHVRIEYGPEGWRLNDLQTENGIVLNGRVYRGQSVVLNSGDTVHVGRTEIRAYDPLHPVPKEVRLQRAHPFLAWLSRPLTVWASFALALAAVTGWTYLEVWSTEPGPQLASACAGTLTVILVWSALWAVAGRLIRHKSRFRSHVALVSLAVVFSFSVFAWIRDYADFLLNENWAAMAVSEALSLVVLVALLYGALSLATDMPQRRKLNAAAMFSVGLLLGLFALSQVAQRNFQQDPQFPTTLKPYLAGLAPSDSPDAFMKGNEELFDSKVLKLEDKKS